MRNQYRKFYIFSACLKTLSTNDNHLRTREAYNTLLDLGLDFACVTGVYKGDTESSFMVFDKENVEENVSALCKLYNQECYLERDNENNGYLVYPNGARDNLGEAREITLTETRNLDSFTILPQKDNVKKYFTFSKAQ